MDLPHFLIESLEGKYELEHEIGRGGMAVVFRARDLRHHRVVAVKIMHPEARARPRARTLPARDPRCRGASASEHRRRARLRGSERRPVLRYAVRRGRDVTPSARAREAPECRRRTSHRARDRRRPRLRARARSCPPRRQAREHSARRHGARSSSGLRHRAGGAVGARRSADRYRGLSRHTGIHGAGAGAR